MRVYELAEQLHITSKELLAELKRMRVPVKNHMSVVGEHNAERITAIYERRRSQKQQEPQQEATVVSEPVEPAAAPSAPSPTPPKPTPGLFKPTLLIRPERPHTDKAKQEAIEKARAAREARRKTLKERRTHRPPPPQVARLLKKKVTQQARGLEPAIEKPETSQPAVAVAPSPAPEEVKVGKKPRARKKRKVLKPGEIIVPTIEVMSFKELKKDIAERWRKRAKGKKVRRKVPGEKVPARGKKIRPSFFVDLEAIPRQKRVSYARRKVAAPPKPRLVTIRGDVSVAEFAEKIDVPLPEIVSKLNMVEETFTEEQILPLEYCELLAEEFGIKAEIIPEDDEYDIRGFLVKDNEENMKPRPPVVTIMGHVDHGKTTLLDSIRKSDIVSGEYGGITQHIGAYCVKTNRGDIVFLDTPGHEAFTAMRARGASVTDIVVLVVAADDGVMPQTIEAINHAKAANVPIIVAINKIDKPGSNPTSIKQQLMGYELLSEELGGDTLYAEVVARTGQDMDKLLDLIHLQAEILDLKADPDRSAEGAILESHVDPLRGVIATVLVQKGTLKISDVILTGNQFGRVRAMVDDHGRSVEEAGPSTSVEVIGLTGVPVVGEPFYVLPDEKTARRIAAIRTIRRRTRGLRQTRHITLENLKDYIDESRTKELNIILKGDVQGSIEAISQSLEKLSTQKVKINILHSAVGGVSESDVYLADASDAIIIGFNVRPETAAAELARDEGVEIKLYRVIYELLDEIQQAMVGLLEPKYKEVEHGRAEVRQIFKVSRVGNVAGCLVVKGEINISDNVHLLRDSVVICDGKIASLRRVKDDVTTVLEGLECGIALQNFNDVKEGDVIETYILEEIAQEL